MKKLMIAAAIVCAAAVSQAALANWSTSASEIHDGTGVEESYFSGTGVALFFDAALMSQSDLFDLWDSGKTIGSSTTGYVSAGDVTTGGSLQNGSFGYGEQGNLDPYSFYFALVDGDSKIYLSNIFTTTANANSSPKPLLFGEQYDYEQGTAFASPNSWALPTEGYVGEGFWATHAVPEPTSGLLLLLGVAGLALRRRRA